MPKPILARTILLSLAIAAMTPALAEVERIEITSREPFIGGMEFGRTGAYEKIRGVLHYAVDPQNEANARVVDLALAPRDADGRVRFAGEFLLLKPVDLGRGNGRLLYDVNNRGNLYMLRHFNDAVGSNDPTEPEHAGNGFLMRGGYSLLWSAWNWDVRPGNDRLQIELPVATEDGRPIRQKILAEIVNSWSRKAQPSLPLAWGNSRCYPALDPQDNGGAVLTRRPTPHAERETVPNDQWRFARVTNGLPVPDPTYIMVDGGLKPGVIYELVYEVENPRVVGLGLTSVRDAISFFHFADADGQGNPNPLADAGADGVRQPPVEKAYIFGVSQSGRFITHMLWQGFHVDEAGRQVFEGARIHVAGGGKGGFNHRFAQTTHHPSHLEGNLMPADHPPFNYLPEGAAPFNDVLAVAKRTGQVPRIIITNNALEYWTRSASLIHTDPHAKRDAPFHRNVRYYMVNGAPHGGAGSRGRTVTEHTRNPISVNPLQRAMLVNLDAWVSEGVEPPPSVYPRIDRGELVTASAHRLAFPAIPGARHPGQNLQPSQVNYGPRFWTEGVFTIVPPRPGARLPTLVPACDADGNGVGGIHLPEVAVPLGTYQGWNPRHADYGAPDYLTRFDGSFWMFPPTEEEGVQTDDPRLSIEARYPAHSVYRSAVEKAVADLVKRRLLLPEDATTYVEQARSILWPPELIDEPPFWHREKP